MTTPEVAQQSILPYGSAKRRGREKSMSVSRMWAMRPIPH